MVGFRIGGLLGGEGSDARFNKELLSTMCAFVLVVLSIPLLKWLSVDSLPHSVPPSGSTSGVTGVTLGPALTSQKNQGALGSFAKWSKVEIDLTGPDSFGMSTSANPFKIIVDVTFQSPGGQTFVVPAFYDGDGAGGLDGNVWKVRFSPNAVGTWRFESSSPDPLLDRHTGSFAVTAPTGCQSATPGTLPDFSCAGRLEYAGGHYLKFADGSYWLKGGQDDPEDFLAPGNTVGFGTKEAAIDYLASKGVNSLYIMLHNIDGDREDVWPWVGSTAAEARANHEHFDVAKLAGWEELFSYLQSKGIVLHLVLEDDHAWTGFNREMYYREMLARFGHDNGLYWNISEEYGGRYTPDQVKSFAQMIHAIDPYDHPVTVHNLVGLENWLPFVGDSRFDLTSFQTLSGPQNTAAVSWFQKVENSGRTIPISFDETGKLSASSRDLARHIIWSVYLGGASFELHTAPLSRYQDFADHFDDMTRARTFMEHLPFWQMRPMNSLLSGSQGYAFAKSGEVYVVYLPSGGSVNIDLSAAPHAFAAEWFNPRDGSRWDIGPVQGGQVLAFTAPDRDDWVLHLTLAGQQPPTPTSTVLPTTTSTATPTPLAGSATPTPASTAPATASPTQPAGSATPTPEPARALLEDSFDRSDSTIVGNGWVEVESSGAEVGIRNKKLEVLNASDAVNRPLVRHSFARVSAGTLVWEFDFNWKRTRSEGRYSVFMQLGDSASMGDSEQNSGIGVNLIWTAIDGSHETLGVLKDGKLAAVSPLSGPARLSVVANLDTHRFDIAVNGSVVQTQLPFDNLVALDTVRFLTDALNEARFSGRTFDNVVIRQLSGPVSAQKRLYLPVVLQEKEFAIATPTPTPTPTPTGEPYP